MHKPALCTSRRCFPELGRGTENPWGDLADPASPMNYREAVPSPESWLDWNAQEADMFGKMGICEFSGLSAFPTEQLLIAINFLDSLWTTDSTTPSSFNSADRASFHLFYAPNRVSQFRKNEEREQRCCCLDLPNPAWNFQVQHGIILAVTDEELCLFAAPQVWVYSLGWEADGYVGVL